MRDPRVDPKALDVLDYGPQWQRERVDVELIKGDVIRCAVGGRPAFFTRREWLEYMKGADIIYAAK